MTSKVFQAQRFVYCDVPHTMPFMVQPEYMSLLNRSGICDGIICCNIFFVHTAARGKMAFLIKFSFLAFFNRYICTLTYYNKEMSVYYNIIQLMCN